jgi:DNA adenine methylase
MPRIAEFVGQRSDCRSFADAIFLDFWPPFPMNFAMSTPERSDYNCRIVAASNRLAMKAVSKGLKTDERQAAATHTFLRWAGSKKKQLPILSSFWNQDFDRYVEPFMGSACLFFRVRPRKAILADINEDLIRTFLTVRKHPRAVSNRLARLPLGKRSYYRVRGQTLANFDPADAAARFIFLNRFCFNGLYRTNRDGQFNVPFGSSGIGRVPTAQELRTVANALRVCTIRHADFYETLKRTKAGDFVYLDPPYALGNRRVFGQYGPSSFGLGDLQRLADALADMDKRGVKFVLSYAACAEASAFFRGWPRRRIFIHRNIAGFAKHRRRAGEVLISNCFPVAA